MANKQYISIIRLFDHCDISTADDFNLSRVKKQLQAEFGIAKDGFIEVDGYVYSRHDVMEEIDLPNFSQRLAYHKQLWMCPQVLQLLEKNSTDLTLIKNELSLFLLDKEFDIFFSPYFVGPFSYISRTLLTEMRLEEIGNLLEYEDFLQPGEREEAFRPIRIFLDDSIKLLRNVKGENYKIIRPKILHWIENDWHPFFNQLPAEFYDVKNEIIAQLINITVAIQKTHRRDCRKISQHLMSLQETPENLRGIVVSNHAVYVGSSSGGSGNWRNLAWIGWVLFMLIRAVASDGCGGSSRNNYQFNPPDFQKYQIPDSILKKIEKSGIKIEPDSTKK